MSFGSYSGAAGALAEELGSIRNRQQTQHDEAKHKLRERQADEIEQAIQGIQSNTSLSPEQKTKDIDAARQQLQALYQPHEAPHMMERLKRIFGGGKSPQSTSGQIELKPGMTLAEVLAAGSPQAPAPKALGQPIQNAKGKWVQMEMDQQGNITAKEVPITEETRKAYWMRQGLTDEQAQQAVEVEAKIKSPAPTSVKPPKYDSKTDTIYDPETQTTYSRGEAGAPDYVQSMFKGAETQEKKREQTARRRFAERLEMQKNAFNYAVEKSDHAKAQGIYDNAKVDLVQSRMRLKTMEDNKQDALNGSQQAMLSLVANHIGMTLGAQKGARITRAVWEEAMDSAPWLDQKISKAFHQDADGNYIFDGWKEGVTLTADQINQMVGLAHQKVDNVQGLVEDMRSEFPEIETGKTPPEKSSKGSTSKKATHFVEGSDSWDIPADKVEAFKRKHPNAKEQ